jgi:hypothetical protein
MSIILLTTRFRTNYGWTAFVWLLTACGGLASSASESVDHEELAATLIGLDRCEPGRLSSTVLEACARAAELTPLTAAEVMGAHPPIISPPFSIPQYSSGVRLPSNGAGSFSGDVLLDATTAGEYILYLSSAGVPVSVFDPGGAELTPVCGHSLPLIPAPAGYPADCKLRAAYSLRLQPKRYLLRLGPSTSSFVRVDMIRRRNSGAVANVSSCDDTQLSSTLSDACTLAVQPTPIAASAFGGGSPLIDSTRAYGARLQPVGGSNEGSLSFTPPYTADYMLYVGTPNAGVAVVGDHFKQVTDACVRPLSSQQVVGECPSLRAAFAFPRLQAGVRHELEVGPLDPQSSWVRTVVLPTAPDSDGDLLADNLDRCPHVAADPGACGCPEGCLETPIWTQQFAAQFFGTDLALDSDGNSYVVGSQGTFKTDLQKSSSAGSLLWTRTLEQRSSRVATAPSGAVVVGGHSSDASNTARPFHLTKYDASGKLQWKNTIDTVVSFGEPPGLAVDPGGNVLSAVTAVKLELGPDPRALVRKHDPSGNPLWSRYLVGAADEPAKARGVTAGADGSVIVVGSLISNKPGSFIAPAAFVAKLSGSGAKLWQWNAVFSGPQPSRYHAHSATDVALDANGNVFVLGATGYKSQSSGGRQHSDVWLAKFSPTGTLLWDTIYDSGVDDEGGALAVDSFGNIAIVGSSRESLVSPQSMWFSRYDGYGLQLWLESPRPDVPLGVGVGVAFDALSNLFVLGAFYPSESGILYSSTLAKYGAASGSP